MKPNTWGWVRFIVLGIGLIILLSFHSLTNGSLWQISIGINVVWLLSFFICEVLFWRCPECGEALPRGAIHMKFCPNCGKALK